jgi:hypothetical protein
MTPQDRDDRRRYPRVKAQIPVELLPSGTAIPMRTVTEEVSLCGCYIPSMFTLEVGKHLEEFCRIRFYFLGKTKLPSGTSEWHRRGKCRVRIDTERTVASWHASELACSGYEETSQASKSA